MVGLGGCIIDLLIKRYPTLRVDRRYLSLVVAGVAMPVRGHENFGALTPTIKGCGGDLDLFDHAVGASDVEEF
eukprot:CAMPEP_0194310910 /NCGR_PEP_ID=MMETSP0171-20130528/7884_1 /TAXON_ID=218684 /ORGANISM="Corethron pennatum, Strain L29A3" /LENGTH=72 /DNA_ID=CAMNT_0039064773 /DNA_START=2571 /DNA_END=2789 /DNA_ORIENTATION=+